MLHQMTQYGKRTITVLSLFSLAILVAACGASEDNNTEAQALPTIVQREAPTQVAVVPTERVLPTLLPLPTEPEVAPQSNVDNNTDTQERPMINTSEVADGTPEVEAEAPQQVFAPPGLFDQNTSEQETGDAGNAPPFAAPGSTDGSNGGGPPFWGGNSSGAETNDSGLPFDVNNESSTGGPPFGGGSDTEGSSTGGPPFGGGSDTEGSSTGGPPFGGSNSDSGNGNSGLPFDPSGGSSGGGTPFGGGSGLPFGGSDGGWFIKGEQPVSVFSCAETTCDILGSIEAGERLTIVEEELDEYGDFIPITYEGNTAYVYAGYTEEREATSSGGPGGGSGLPFDPGGGVSGGPPGGGGGLPFDPGGGGGSGLPFDPGGGGGDTPPFLTGGGGTPSDNGAFTTGTFPQPSGFGSPGGDNPLYTEPDPSGPGGPGGDNPSCPPFLPNC